jgi:glucosamine kinase
LKSVQAIPLFKWSYFGIMNVGRIRMTLFLGVDGGGTGCRAAVADGFGRIIGQGQAGPANIASDLGQARDNILLATREALTIATGSGAELPDLTAGLALAGANARGAAAALRQTLPFARIRIETDALAAVKGALGRRDGIVAAIGTGSVFGSQVDGHIRQIGGWGLVLGDEGSGAWLGRRLMTAAMRAMDGFQPMTPLLHEILEEHGGAEGLIAFSLGARPADLAVLAPRLFATDDPAAVDVLTRAVADVSEAVDVLQCDPPLPVTFIGGLGPAYAAQFAGRWDIVPAQGSALDGALMLAQEAV